MKVTLQIDGEKRTFSNVKDISIEEENVKSSIEDKNFEVAEKPTEEKWFKVKPQSIDQELFKKKREDEKQEKTRQLILEAFEELRKNPEKYGKKFKTMMPRKYWTSETVAELKELSCQLGDHMADWVEQSLEWAQRIANKESWEAICNIPDTANWYRAISWKNGYTRAVGGSVRCDTTTVHASHVGRGDYDDDEILFVTVPLVVAYDEEESAA